MENISEEVMLLSLKGWIPMALKSEKMEYFVILNWGIGLALCGPHLSDILGDIIELPINSRMSFEDYENTSWNKIPEYWLRKVIPIMQNG